MAHTCNMLRAYTITHLFIPRWLKIFHVSLASEQKQRAIAKDTVGEAFSAEMVPFTFPTEGREEIREAPFVYVPNLIARVADALSHQLE